jgi:hypothetical protein
MMSLRNVMDRRSRFYFHAGIAVQLAVAFLTRLPLAAQSPPKSTAATVANGAAMDRSPWERIVLIGASATAGFTMSEPLGGPTTARYFLHRYIDAALTVPHEPVKNVAHAFFFLQPETTARRQIDQAIATKPTVVGALDFLFWFCYGPGATDAERQQRFEKGLKFLEEVPCPLVVGDIPDASGVSDEVISPDWIPSVAARTAANRRLKEWAAGRKDVVVVSLSEFMHAALSNQALTIHGVTFPAGKTRGLLQGDQLHPSTRGCTALALAMIDALQSAHPARFAGDVRWNAAEVTRLGSGATNAIVTTTNIPATKPSPPVKSGDAPR